jgi:UDP-glucose 4-epimerase
VHIADLVSAHLLALETLQSRDALICNVGSGQGFSVRQVVETARSVTGHAIPAIEEARRPGDPPRLVASSDKIRRELGWKAEHSDLKEMVSSAWEWHKSHPKGYDTP